MTPETWAKLAKIFEEALELPPTQRTEFICRACSDDLELETQLRNLLAADNLAGGFLEAPAPQCLTSPVLSSQIVVLSPGDVLLNRFEIVRFLGRGGMGQVFEAFDRVLNDRIAIKVLNPDISGNPEAVKRFKSEVQFTRRVTHPNVCRTFDLEQCVFAGGDKYSAATSIMFLTMELLQGETLQSYMSRYGPVPTPRALPIVEQIVAGLDAAHSAGVVHRDFKPSNVVVIQNANSVRAVVTDFGVARAFSSEGDTVRSAVASSATCSANLIGTLDYMAPEQLELGVSTPASDVYALGLVLYELTTNRRAFESATPFGSISDRLRHKPVSPKQFAPELDSNWEAAILKCLEIRPELRFQTAGEVLLAVQQFRGTESRSIRLFPRSVSSKPHKLGSLFRLRPLVSASILVALLLALSGTVLRLMSRYRGHLALHRGSTLMLTAIDNDSRDRDLDAVTELVRNQLEQSTYMNLLSPGDVQEALERMALPRNSQITPSIAREVALRKAVPLVVFGAVSRISDDYRLDLKLERVGDQPLYPATSREFSRSAPDKKSLLGVVRDACVWVRSEAGEARNEIDENDRRTEDVTTESWEALKFYSDGQRLAADGHLADAILLYKEAVSKDPQFAMALMRAGDTLDTIGQTDEGMKFWSQALAVEGARRLTGREELRIKGMFANDVGDLKTAIDSFGQYSVSYPDDYLGYFYRAYPLMLIGRSDEAVEMLRKAETRAPNSYYIADHLARYLLILGEFSSAEEYLKRERALGKSQNADLVEGQLKFLLGQHEAAEQYFINLQTSEDQFVQSSSYYLLASVYAEDGRYREAVRTLQQGSVIDARSGATADRAQKLLALAYLYWKMGDSAHSRQAALQSIRIEPGPRQAGDAAILLARAGSLTEADAVLLSLKSESPSLLVNVVSLRLRGEILLAKGRNHAAVAVLNDWKKLNQERASLQDSWAYAAFASGRYDECLGEIDDMLQAPGQIWHQAEAYFPGYLADLRWMHAKAIAKVNQSKAKEELTEYLDARRRGDSDLPDLREARSLAATIDGRKF